jgi:hypothetical protein
MSHDDGDLAILSLRIDPDESEIDITATRVTEWVASEKRWKRRMFPKGKPSSDPPGRIARTQL